MKITIRPWIREDAPYIPALISDAAVQSNLRDGLPLPYTQADALAYIVSCLEADPDSQYTWAALADGVPVGSIGVFRGQNIHSRTGDLGYWFGRPYWNHGIATQAVALVCKEIFSQTDIMRIYAEPFSDNIGSCRVLEKCGFLMEGVLRKNAVKNGVVRDMKMYALTR